MASYPDFEPEVFTISGDTEKRTLYLTGQMGSMFNRAIQGDYAPGSIFKMATAIAALESGNVTITEKINDTGIYPLAYKPRCWYYNDYKKGHGLLNVSDAIKKSCNYFFYEMGNRMGIDTLAKYATYFGLGQKTGIELPSETSGTLASRESDYAKNNGWYLGDTLSAVIGQSVNDFSPMQIAKYISILCNGGKKINPTIIRQIVNVDGSEVPKDEIESFVNQKLGLEEQVIESMEFKEENIKAVLEGMRSVAMESGGTAYNIFKDFEIEIGGKTGSAEAGTFTNAWFAGFAPFDNPEIAVVVLVENGGHGNYTGEVVREIIREYFGMNTESVIESVQAVPYIEMQN